MAGMPGEDHFNSGPVRIHIFGKILRICIYVMYFSVCAVGVYMAVPAYWLCIAGGAGAGGVVFQVVSSPRLNQGGCAGVPAVSGGQAYDGIPVRAWAFTWMR